MRLRTVLLALAGVLFINTRIVLGAWWWFQLPPAPSPEAAPTSPKASPVATAETLPEPVRREKPTTVVANPALPAPNVGAMWAQIESPDDGDGVPRRFRATVRAGAVPADHRLLLVVDPGRSVFSPKVPMLTMENETWAGTVNEFGAPVGGNFSLCVFMVTEEAAQQIEQWHAHGKATGQWAPFRGSLPGGVELTRIKLRVAR